MSGVRLLLLDDIGDAGATQVSSAWANADGTGLVAVSYTHLRAHET